MEKNLFELAARKKYRFQFKGIITTEDLWDLSPVNLDAIYKGLKAEERQQTEVSLLKEIVADEELKNKIAIIEYIAQVKKTEKDAATNAKLKADNKKRIQDIINKKQNEALEGKSIEELEALLAD